MKTGVLTNKESSNAAKVLQQLAQTNVMEAELKYVTQNVPSRHASFSSEGTEPDYDMSTSATIKQNLWDLSVPTARHAHQQHQVVHPLDSTMMLNSWDSSVAENLKQNDFNVIDIQRVLQQQQFQQQQEQMNTRAMFLNSLEFETDNANYPLLNMMPQTPHTTQSNDYGMIMDSIAYTFSETDNNSTTPSMTSAAFSTPKNSGLITPPAANCFTARTSLPNNSTQNKKPSYSRSSLEVHRYGRRVPSHPSVASVVSLTAHEPVSKMINGIEYITFLYSHDRLVKEYTVQTNVDSVNIHDITMDFRIQNAIYPRANVDRSEYDGNRWDYETTCNQLGWKLCWLNKDQLFGRRGLIQRAVDSYRNRHAEMRSRRVTRQEKVASGTLRKRRSKKSFSS